MACIIHTHEHLQLLCFWQGFRVCETSDRQRTKRLSRHFFIYVSPPLRFCISAWVLIWRRCKDTYLYANIQTLSKKNKNYRNIYHSYMNQIRRKVLTHGEWSHQLIPWDGTCWEILSSSTKQSCLKDKRSL